MPSPFRAHPTRSRAILPLMLAGFAARAATHTWDGATALWNTAHWNPGPVTGASITTADTAVIGSGQVSFAQNDTYGNHLTGATPLIQLNTGGTLASGGFFNALINLNLNGGTLLGTGGVNSPYGAFALKGTVSVTGGSASAISVGSGSLNTVSIGNGTANASTTFNVADVTGSTAADLTIGMVLNNIANVQSGLIKSGAGTLLLTADNTYTGTTDVQAGTLTLGRSGGTLANAAAVTVSGGVLDVANSDTVGAVTLTSGAISGAGTLTGSFNLQAGTVTAALGGASGLVKSGSGTVFLGGVNTYTGNTDVQAGTLRVTGGSISTSSRLDIGTVGNAAHFQLDSGASVTVGSQFVIGAHGSTGVATLGGGTLQVNGTLYLGGYGEGTGTGTITHTAGNVTSTAGVNFGGGGPNHGVYNLGGGVLTTTAISKAGSGSATFNFNGGTLRPSAASASFLQGLSAANVQAGGGSLDTQGFDITIAQPLLHDAGLGVTPDGGLAKNGSGILTLSGGNTFTGNLVINQGTVSTTTAFNNATPSTTNIGNMTVSGRQIQINSGATLSFGSHDAIGSIAALQPTSLVVDGGTVTRNNFFVTVPAITLQNGGVLTGGNGANANFQSYNLMGTVTAGGTTGSSITTTGATNLGIHLGQNNIDFAVADTGSATDLTVSAPLINKPSTLAAAGITKTGAGTMLLSGANGFTGPTAVNGGVLALSGGASLSDSAALTLANTSGAAVQLNSNETVGSLAGGGASGGNVNLQSNTLTAGGDGTSTAFSGVISGTGSLVKAGAGTLTLNNNNTFSGALVLGAGTVTVASGAALSSVGSVTTRGGGVLRVDGSITQAPNSYFATGNGVASNTGTTLINSGASVNVGGNAVLIGGSTSGNGQYGQGTLTLNGGTLTVGAQSGTGGGSDNANVWLNPYGTSGTSTLNLDAGTFNTARSVTKGSGSSTLVNLNGGTLNFTATGRTLTVDRVNVRNGGAVISAQAGVTASVTTSGLLHSNVGGDNAVDGGLTKLGAGTLSINAASTYTGPTVVNNGTLTFAGGGNILTTSPIAVNSGGTLTFNRNDTWGIHTSNVSPQVTVNAGGTLASSGFYNTLVDPILSGGQVILNGGANVNFGAFAFKGTVTVNGSQASTISAGSGSNNSISIGPTTVAGATVFDVANVTGNAAADLTVGVTLKNNFAVAELANGITKTGAGTLLLSGANTFTGAATVNNGTLVLAGGGAIADTAPVVLANTAGATLQLNNSETVGSLAGGGASGGNVDLQGNILTAGSNGSSTTYSGTISGSGSFVKAGAGELTLDTTHAHTGKTTVTGGTLNVPTGNPQTFGANPGAFVADQVRLSGGTLRVSNASLAFTSNRGLTIGNTGVTAGTLLVEPGLTLSVATPLSATEGNVTKAGSGSVNLTATATYNALTISGGTFRQNSGVSTVNTISSGLQVGAVGAYELNGGTLRTDALTIAVGGSFTWGAATLAAKSTQGSDGGTDFSAAGYQVVRSGTTLQVNGALDSSSGSVLALHGSPSFYSNNGIRFTNILISGDLDLASAGDTLAVEISPYLLRPFSPTLGSGAEDSGSIPLVVVDGNLTGTFDTFGNVYSEGAGFAEFLGSFSTLGDLTPNTWKLQYVQDVVNPSGFAPGSYDIVYFHYRVTGYVPEPESFGLMLAGALSLRYLRRRPARAEPEPARPGKRRRIRRR